MTKTEELVVAATALSDEQLESLMGWTQYLTDEPCYNSAPDHVLAAIDRGIAEAEAGLGVAGQQVFERLSRKIAARQY